MIRLFLLEESESLIAVGVWMLEYTRMDGSGLMALLGLGQGNIHEWLVLNCRR